METLMTQPALVGDHLVLRTATEEAEIDHLRRKSTNQTTALPTGGAYPPYPPDPSANCYPRGSGGFDESTTNPLNGWIVRFAIWIDFQDWLGTCLESA